MTVKTLRFANMYVFVLNIMQYCANANIFMYVYLEIVKIKWPLRVVPVYKQPFKRPGWVDPR